MATKKPTRKTAQEIEVGDLLNSQYKVIWISKFVPRNGTCSFDVKDTRDNGLCKKVQCPPSTTFEVS